RAEDRRLNARPIQSASIEENLQVIRCEISDLIVCEQATVEVLDAVNAEEAPSCHRSKELAEQGRKLGRTVASLLDKAGAQVLAEQTMSSANRQKSRRTRKRAASAGSSRRARRLALRRANSPAACSVT